MSQCALKLEGERAIVLCEAKIRDLRALVENSTADALAEVEELTAKLKEVRNWADDNARQAADELKMHTTTVKAYR